MWWALPIIFSLSIFYIYSIHNTALNLNHPYCLSFNLKCQHQTKVWLHMYTLVKKGEWQFTCLHHGLVDFVLGYKNCSLAGQHHLSYSLGSNSKLLIFYNRHMEWFGLEDTLRFTCSSPPCPGQGWHPLDQVTQSPFQPGLEHTVLTVHHDLATTCQWAVCLHTA